MYHNVIPKYINQFKLVFFTNYMMYVISYTQLYMYSFSLTWKYILSTDKFK